MLDRFSVLWGEEGDPELEQALVGNPKLMAEIWGVPVESIENYLVCWDKPEEGTPPWGRIHDPNLEYAYPGDEFGYGYGAQGIDFIRALMIPFPYEGEDGVRTHAVRIDAMPFEPIDAKVGFLKRFTCRLRR